MIIILYFRKNATVETTREFHSKWVQRCTVHGFSMRDAIREEITITTSKYSTNQNHEMAASKKIPLRERSLSEAATYGDFEKMEWLYEK